MKPKTPFYILLLGASFLFAATLYAADGTWNVDADGNWSDTGNWTGGIVADGADFTATFDGISASRTVTLDTARTIGNISFDDGSDHLEIAGVNTLTLDTTSGTPTIDVDNEELTITSVIDGNDGLAKTGAGILRLNAANTFTGGVDFSAGQIIVRSSYDPGSFGDTTNVLTFSSDARFHNSAGTFAMAQAITINGGVTARCSGAFGERTEMSGVLAGSGTFQVDGASAGWTFECRNTANTFTGPIEVLGNGGHSILRMRSLADSAGTIKLGRNNATNGAGYLEYQSGATTPLVLNSRQFVVRDRWTNVTSDRVTGIRNNAATANTITVNTDLSVTSSDNALFGLGGSNTGDNTFAGAIPDVGGTGTLGLVKRDGGKWILTGVNTYEGDTTILNGTLEIGGAGQLGGGNYAGNISNQDASPNPLTFAGSADQTISGVISGAADLIKDGAGILSLTNANTYTGDTTVLDGTLSLGDGTNNSNLDDFSTMSVDTGAVLELNYSGSDSVLLLNLGGSPAAAGTWGRIGSIAALGADFESAQITGDGLINNQVTLANLFFWDGGTTDIVGDGDAVSAGGSGTWDITTQNWDVGIGPHAAWGNTASDDAIFGGSTGTVTLDAEMNIENMNIEVPNGGGSGYSIGDSAEDNTLTFGGNKTITITATGSGSRNDHTIRAGIAGAPTLNIAGRNNNDSIFQLLPPAGVTMTLGSVNEFNTLASNKRLVLGGASTGNVADAVTWELTNNQLFVTKRGTGDWTITNNLNIDDGRLYVEEGTLTCSGNTNFFSHLIEIQDGGRLVAQGDWRINDEDQDFIIRSGGTLAPGGSVGMMALSWNDTRSNPGQVNFQTGSTYEWEVGAANATDVFDLQELGGSDAELLVGSGTFLKVVDSGGSPSPGDQLTVFTYDAGVVTPDTATLNANMTIDLTGTTWTGPGSFVNDSAGTIYITGISSGGGTPYENWAGGELFNDDKNGDGVANGMAFLLGAPDPDADARGLLPTPAEDGSGGLVMTFSMLNLASRGGAVLNVEHSSDLGVGDSWTSVLVPETSGGPTLGVTFVVSVNGINANLNDVVATISSSEAAGGKLFGRLVGEE